MNTLHKRTAITTDAGKKGAGGGGGGGGSGGGGGGGGRDAMDVDGDDGPSHRVTGAAPKKILASKSSLSTARPDISLLVLYGGGGTSDGGGGFARGGSRQGAALAVALSQFMTALPPPQAWDGPIVDVERLLLSIRDAPYERVLLNSAPASSKSSMMMTTTTTDVAELSDDEDGGGGGGEGGMKRGAEGTDIFKKRMMKKFKPNPS